eukprot:6180549-Karenia_brevis.AAC.1
MGSDKAKDAMAKCKADILEALSQQGFVQPHVCLKLIKDIASSKFCLADRNLLMDAVTDRGKVSKTDTINQKTDKDKSQDHFAIHTMLTKVKWQMLMDHAVPHVKK